MLALLASAGAWRRLVVRVVVEGDSMAPALRPGDRVVVVRTPVLEEGDLVALFDPEDRSRVLVKRVARLEAESIDVRGDNVAASRDSRSFGPVPRRLVIGRVVYRYAPADSVPIGRGGRRAGTPPPLGPARRRRRAAKS